MPDWLQRGLRGSVVLVGAALLFSWFGVYNTYQLPMLPRFGFWLLTMVVGGVSSAITMPWVLTGPARDLPDPLKILMTSIIISVPITGTLLILSTGEISTRFAAVQYGYVFVVSVVVTTVVWYTQRLSNRAQETGDSVVDPLAKFMERLPVKYRTADLYAVSAEDHYLRVHTSVGEELILMRFGDAMRELGMADGLQTHRSWWVSSSGVADSRRDAGKLVLVLKSGGEAAVSRTYAGAVKEAGLL
ncbi:MAG: LytTR family DNA-binding domain-containing protein [Pseudomonadota bacterium]